MRPLGTAHSYFSLSTVPSTSTADTYTATQTSNYNTNFITEIKLRYYYC
jgi:hypothetical protein